MPDDFRYLLPPQPPPRKEWIHLGCWMVGAFLLTILAFSVFRRCAQDRQESLADPTKVRQPAMPEPSPFNALTFPTSADLLVGTAEERARVFMPTASGRPESPLYGSTRTGRDNRARFHAGVDIAPTRRDRSGRALDSVSAIADGKVAYINRSGGGSSYGLYVVVIHEDPVGPVYSLYAHLASVAEGLRVGTRVRAGARLGKMGHSANTGIPVARSHLHLEIGLLLSSRFSAWAKARGIRPDRGNHHGWNLVAVDPLAVYAEQRKTAHFTLAAHLNALPAAFELILFSARSLDYFSRHPSLWKGQDDASGVLVLRVSEGGVILSGRPATPVEQEAFQQLQTPLVRNVDEAVLGRNGMHLVTRARGRWVLGRGAARWLDVLTY